MDSQVKRWILVAGAAALLLEPAVAAGQVAASSVKVNVAGAVTAAGAEPVVCSGQASVTTTAVTDPSLKPFSVVSVDVTGLACTGQLTRARYVNTGQADLTRPLAATDVVETTFAVHPDAPDGHLRARTALLRLTLVYHPVTGALLSAAGTIGTFQ
jgi:hypothetical protein